MSQSTLRSGRPWSSWVALVVLVCAARACSTGAGGTSRATSAREPGTRLRAIVVSFDAFNEQRVTGTIAAEQIPAITALFARGACANGARAAFPTKTAPGHASLWTGAYGNLTGISANSQPTLPRSTHSLLELSSGYDAASLRAEPIWLPAARAGLNVVGHHVTQAPGAPGYREIGEEPDGGARLGAARERAMATLERSNLLLLNGYNRPYSRDLFITESVAPARRAAGWRGIDGLRTTVAPREIAWKAGDDSLYALFFGEGRYTHAVIARDRDARSGVAVRAIEAAPIDSMWPRAGSAERPLARDFSSPLRIPLADGGVVFAKFRLFALSDDASRFFLAQPAINIVQSNHDEEAAAYLSAIGGWTPQMGTFHLEGDRLGAPLHDGGDGLAEARMLELAEHATKQFIAGADWAWRTRRADLLLDYFPGGDDADHVYWGWVSPGAPRARADVTRRYAQVRTRLWSLVDRRLAHLQSLVAGDARSVLFVTGDHGMRATWRTFRPNAALREAGLLALDTQGRIDLSRTKVLSPGGEYLAINRVAWRGGIVAPQEEASVLQAAEGALRAVRDSGGAPVVSAIWRSGNAEGDSLGLGGPSGGDLYFDLAPGFYFSSDVRGPTTLSRPTPAGAHGFPSTAADMKTVFCVIGDTIRAKRMPEARTIDVAPTAADWLGIPVPADARGTSLLRSLFGGRREVGDGR